VKDAEAAAEVLMQRLATAQGKTISTQQLLTEEQQKLAKAKKELQDDTKTTQEQLSGEKQKLEKARKELQDVQDEAKNLKKDEKTNKLIRALSWDGKDVNSTFFPVLFILE
jgi:seryl-tRNA synthetase